MKMDGDIRVRTSKDHQQLYNDLKGLLVKDFHELFFLTACLGYRHGCQVNLGKSAEDRLWSKTITPDEWCTYYSMALAKNGMDFSVVKDDKAVIAEIEGYAHGGMLFFIENTLNGYLLEKESGLSVDKSVSQDLPRRVMQSLFETAVKG